MRLAPVPLFFASIPSDAIYYSGESSKTTHGNVEAVDSCRYFASLILGALYGEAKDVILGKSYSPIDGYWDHYELCENVKKISHGWYKNKIRSEIKSTGYVVDSLEASLWAFYQADSFEEGLVRAVNLGGDSDTIGAIYGQLAGAFYGESKIPYKFIRKLYNPHYFYYMADEMCMYYCGPPVLK